MSIFVWFLPAFYGIGWGKFVVLSVCLLCPVFYLFYLLTLAPLTSMTELSSVDSGKHYNTFLKGIKIKREHVITSCIGPGRVLLL